jgi:hypothetical protein
MKIWGAKLARVVRKTFLFLPLFAIVILLFFSSWPCETSYTEPKFGFSFHPHQASYLGLDPQKTYLALLDGLRPSFIRVPVFWDEVQKERGGFDFSNIDFFVSEAQKRDIKVTVALGYTIFRYPECREPRWAWDLRDEEFDKSLLSYLEKAVTRLSNFDNIEAWQVENEQELWLIKPQCRVIKTELFKKEIEVVKKADKLNRPIVVTHGAQTRIGNFWQGKILLGDIFAVSFFGKSYNKNLHLYTNRLWFRNISVEKAVTEKQGRHFWISEFQAEPWGRTPLNKISPEEAKESMNPAILKENIELLKKFGGAERVYFWGVEWWCKELLEGRSGMWEVGKLLVGG